MRFLHTADVHLGHQQDGSQQRFNDFSHVFLHIIDQAVARQVDFVLLAGDLFEKRTVDPLAMRVAVEGLGQLRAAGIPALAVEGNHERAYYRDQYSWIDFLDALGYVYLLNPRIEDGRALWAQLPLTVASLKDSALVMFFAICNWLLLATIVVSLVLQRAQRRAVVEDVAKE